MLRYLVDSFALLFILALGLFPSKSQAESASPKDWLRIGVQLKAEELHWKRELKLLREKNAPDSEMEREAVQEKLDGAKSSLKEFISMLPEGSPWAQGLALALKGGGETKGRSLASVSFRPSLEELRRSFPDARRLKPDEWSAIRDLCGARAEESFLKETFAAETLPSNSRDAKIENDKYVLVMVRDMFNSIAEVSTRPEFLALAKALPFPKGTDKSLMKKGWEVAELPLNAYRSLEDQADDLLQRLREVSVRYPHKKLVLLSGGEASAIVRKYLDQHPEEKQWERIAAWINYDGRLFGWKDGAARVPASGKKKSPVDLFEEQALQQLHAMGREGSYRQLPLSSKGFPVYNVLHTEEKSRTTPELRDGIVDGGKTYWIESAKSKDDLVHALNVLVLSSR